jgi:glycosyltransferase involved in cell wall biosynthesis
MKKILMLSYYYPPLTDVGGLRALAFSKYLPECGWEPYVVAVRNPDKHWCTVGDGKPPAGVKTYYTRSVLNLTWITGKLNGLLSKILRPLGRQLDKPFIRDLFCIPDQFIGWIPFTFLKGLQSIRKHDIDLIYVSCKPFSSAIIGALLKYVTKRPLVLDFRDPVSPLCFISKSKYDRYLPSFRLTKKIEEKVLRYTDALILVTEETKDLYQSFFPFVRDKTHVIYNGFMDEYFTGSYEPFAQFTIVYSGNFYPELIPPDPFFKALQKVFKERSDLREVIKMVYVGDNSDWLEGMMKKYDLHGMITVTGYVSRQESIEYIYRSSMMLLRIVPRMISTKLFEGLAAGIPFLALVTEGEVASLIRSYSVAPYYIVQPNDIEAIAGAIRGAYDKWQTGAFNREINQQYYKEFNKRGLTEKFSRILNDVSQ